MNADPHNPADSTADSTTGNRDGRGQGGPGEGAPAGQETARGRAARALGSLRGLAVGDGLGSQFFVPAHLGALRRRELPPAPWQWTDDTEMACSVVAVLAAHGEIDQDALAAAFARHHDFDRGYGPAVNRMLRLIRQEGADWRELAASLFEGQGSWGNGAAMRIAPLGAWFADDPAHAVEQAERSAFVTHQHREAVAGAIAVAGAAALVAGDPAGPGAGTVPSVETGAEMLARLIDMVPRSAVEAGLRRAADMLDYDDVATVAAVLGSGRQTSAHDTVPFTLWAAARHLDDYEQAIWTTAQAGGDVDTTCAIVGGIVASRPSGAPPAAWADRTEPLPEWVPEQASAGSGPGTAG
ncbi:ADP-ribosylglycohydrolase family protein [Streptomyces sp. N2-109]|uniref:ADP-ribosylglycohydrolase family protein n=1 Tax=Streptomyces gossypii TaxID=2883101 RepID=A0ABT2JTB6_9ACTN|nr:ADP-ribosylglycohydrolase family protein [Streptomyces gossypii]MCT2590605.1 ADP-ribosylglycohydrolase family protein [Streptomyces gossypii]